MSFKIKEEFMKTIYCLLLVLIPTAILTQNLQFKARYQEAPIIIKDGKKYSTLVKIKFTKGLINTKKNQKELLFDEIKNEDVKSLFDSIKRDYGNFVIIKTFPNTFVDDTIRFSKRLNKYVSVPDLSQHFKLLFDKEIPLETVIRQLKEQKFIISADPPLASMACYDPNDPYYWNNSKWAFDKIEAQKAWNITKGDPSIKIAIHDQFNGGISTLHQDLIGNVISDNGKYCGHGITVAGIAAGKTDNNMGIASIGFNCKLILTQHYVNETLENIYNAANNADVINFSWITVTDAADLRDVIHYAINNGVICVASAGNHQQEHGYVVPKKFEPASFSFSSGQVIAVTGTELISGTEMFRDGWNYSPGTDPINDPQNSFVDFSSPGGGYSIIYQNTSPYIVNGYLHENNFGSSIAAPFVSGTIGLILSANYNLDQQQVYNILKHSTDKVGVDQYYQQSDGHTWNQYMGYGRINAYKALKYTLENYGGTLTQTFTIPSGETWNFQPGVTVKFANGVSLIVNGTLNAVGTQSNKITFTRSGTTGNWGSIIFSGSGASGSTLNYVDMQYGTNIQATSTSNITIQNSTFTNNSNAITFTGSTGTVLNCYISSNSSAGIIVQNGSTVTCNYNTIKSSVTGLAYLAGSYGNIGQNDIAYNSNSGIIVGSSCSPLFKNVPYTNSRNNRITNNGRGINITSTNSLPVMYNAINCTGQNTIYDNSPYDIYNGCSYTLDAIGVYWKNGNPSYSLTYGPIYKFPYIASDPWAGIPLPKQNESSYQSNDPLLVGSQLRGEGKYKEAKDFYISYLEKNPDDQRAYVELYSCYTNETASEITRFFEKAAKKDKEQDLLLGYIYLKQGKIKPAKNINEAVLSSSKNNRVTTLASLNNFYISLYYENDESTATAILERLKREKNETIEHEISFAEYALKTYVPVEFKAAEIQPKELVEQTTPPIPEKLLLYDNFPNPFNPSTTIRYQIPQDGHISLKVYDMLGREVAHLVNEVKRAGEYTASFDGSKLSSGVYIYKLVGNNVNLSKKMILMK